MLDVYVFLYPCLHKPHWCQSPLLTRVVTGVAHASAAAGDRLGALDDAGRRHHRLRSQPVHARLAAQGAPRSGACRFCQQQVAAAISGGVLHVMAHRQLAGNACGVRNGQYKGTCGCTTVGRRMPETVSLMLSAGRHSSAHPGLQRVAAQRLAAELAAQQRHGVAAGLAAARLQSAAAGRRLGSGRTAGAGAPQLPRPHGLTELCCSGDSPE